MNPLSLRFSKFADGRSVRRWAERADLAETLDLHDLRSLRQSARELQNRVARVARVAEGRLALPLVGSNVVEAPLHSDWTWRPELWRLPLDTPGRAACANESRLGEEVTVFHNDPAPELIFRQTRNSRDEDLAPFGLRMEVFHFGGTYLSIVLDLPGQAVSGLQRRHLVRLAAIIEREQPLEIFARLNIRHGPNTEQIVREIPMGDENIAVDFDLAYSNLNEKRVERAWVDLIFENPNMNMLQIRDLVLSRRPRAEV